jgi:hypothetical protein
MRRIAVAAAVVATAVLSTVPAVASSGQDRPAPCSVVHSAGRADGPTVTAAFRVDCSPADPTFEITSLDQRTTIKELSPAAAGRSCEQHTPGTAALMSCTMPAAAARSYLVTYRFTAHGSYAGCADDGTCTQAKGFESPWCTASLGGKGALLDDAVVMDCTYHDIVAAALLR